MDMNQRLAELRKSKGLTQKELAEALNVTRQAVSRWEVGTAAPSLDNLTYLSRLYSIPLDGLVNAGDTGPETAEEMPDGALGTAPEPESPTVSLPANAVRPRAALVPLLLAVLILGVGILIGINLRKEPEEQNSRTGPGERVVVGELSAGWLEKTPADIEDEKQYLEMESGGQVVGYYYPAKGILETLPIDTSEETPTPP